MFTMLHSGYALQPPKLVECSAPLQCNNFTHFATSPYSSRVSSSSKIFGAQTLKLDGKFIFMAKGRNQQLRAGNLDMDVEGVSDEFEDESEVDGPRRRFREKEEEKDYDRDPEFAEILGSCLDDPEKAQSKMEERLRKKRNKILHTKTGSGSPMKVIFNKFNFSNSYIWFEFYNPPLEKDISLICDTIRSWHIIGRLGGCNSLNMQVILVIKCFSPSITSEHKAEKEKKDPPHNSSWAEMNLQ